MADDEMVDFERTDFAHEGRRHAVFRKGAGPAVVVLAEIPGITPRVLDFARRLPELGLTAILPHLFGVPGRDPTPSARGRVAAVANLVSVLGSVCVSRAFTVFATGRTSPVVGWLRALAAHERARCGGPGVGVVGMCFTGGFALAMAVDEHVIAPVLSQPSLPVAFSQGGRRSVGMSDTDFHTVRQRCVAGELDVMGLRFHGDRLCPSERFGFLREQLGDAFLGIELDPAHANPNAPTAPHSVLTEHLIDQAGEPTRAALERVLQFLVNRLHRPSTV